MTDHIICSLLRHYTQHTARFTEALSGLKEEHCPFWTWPLLTHVAAAPGFDKNDLWPSSSALYHWALSRTFQIRVYRESFVRVKHEPGLKKKKALSCGRGSCPESPSPTVFRVKRWSGVEWKSVFGAQICNELSVTFW